MFIIHLTITPSSNIHSKNRSIISITRIKICIYWCFNVSTLIIACHCWRSVCANVYQCTYSIDYFGRMWISLCCWFFGFFEKLARGQLWKWETWVLLMCLGVLEENRWNIILSYQYFETKCRTNNIQSK